jgi:hypothetical protein
MDQRNRKRNENNFNNFRAHMPPQQSCPVQRIQSYLSIRAFASIQSCGATMSNEQQARKMLTSSTKTTGGFEYAGEYYTACCAFLSGTDPSMPSKALIHPNEQTVDRLLKVTGGNSKLHTGEGLITKAKRDRAELQNCYMPLLTNEVVRSYPNIGSGKTWEQIQEDFRLRLWQERCKVLLNENMKDVEKALKDAQGRFQGRAGGSPSGSGGSPSGSPSGSGWQAFRGRRQRPSGQACAQAV